MTDPIKECVEWLRLSANRHEMYKQWADAIEALQAERDSLATQLKGEKLWEERCADLEAHIIEIRGVVLMCWGAMAEISPCAHEDCKQQQTETLDLALRKSDELLRKWRELEQERKRKEWAQQDAANARQQRDHAEARRRAAKGQLTKVKKRVGNGVCPCCNRTFADLQRHMHSKHPDYEKSSGA